MRPYLKDEEARIPENYSGTSIKEEPNEERESEPTGANPWEKISESESEIEASKDVKRFFPPGLGKLFSRGGIKALLPSIGTEEILIIALAAFLFLSRDGDKECAVMLLILLIL